MVSSRRQFLFVTWPGGGNVPPLVALGALLREHGHAVRVLGPPQLAARFEAEGMTYIPGEVGASMSDAPASDAARQKMLRAAADAVAGEALKSASDAIVVDFMQPEALCGAESSGLPTVAFVHTLYRRFAVAPASFHAMNIIASDEDIRGLRAELRLPDVPTATDLLDRASRVFVVAPRSLDGDGCPLPANVRYVGPIVERPGPDAAWAPRWSASAVPMIVASLGTTPMDEEAVLQRVLDATATLPVQIVVTLPGHLDAQSFRLGRNAATVGFVRHSALLPHARLFITHAGLGGISAALACGVPMLCLPLGRDQDTNAAAVAEAGFGRALSPNAEVDELRAAIVSASADDRLRGNVVREAEHLRADGGPQEAVRELERLAAAS